MSGNVNEWCFDWYGAYPSGSLINYKGPSSGSYRSLRGGSWISGQDSLIVNNRKYFFPGTLYDYDGIRPVRN